eukprot:2756301-Amphidinium_carterae.2
MSRCPARPRVTGDVSRSRPFWRSNENLSNQRSSSPPELQSRSCSAKRSNGVLSGVNVLLPSSDYSLIYRYYDH